MELSTLIAQWSGKLPPGFVPQAVLREEPEECSQHLCRRKRAPKPEGGWYASCQPCLDRRAASCRRRRAALVAEGGCRRCAYRQRLAGDFLCERCREERDIERAQKRRDALDAAAIDEFAARPEQGARALQPRLRCQPVERQAQAAGDRSLLESAPGPGASRGARVGQVHLRRRPRVSSLLIPAFPAGARGSPQSRVPIHQPNRNRTTNDNHDSQPELIDEQMERFEIDKIRLETQLIKATMRRDRVRLVLDIAKWTVIAAAVVLATIAADHVGLI